MSALFLRHEGYLGALGCFLKAHPIDTPAISDQGNGLKVGCLNTCMSSAAVGLSCLLHPRVSLVCLATCLHAWPHLAMNFSTGGHVDLMHLCRKQVALPPCVLPLTPLTDSWMTEVWCVGDGGENVEQMPPVHHIEPWVVIASGCDCVACCCTLATKQATRLLSHNRNKYSCVGQAQGSDGSPEHGPSSLCRCRQHEAARVRHTAAEAGHAACSPMPDLPLHFGPDPLLILAHLQLRGSFVERFSMGAPYLGGQVQGPPFRDVHQKVDWVERFVQLGTAASKAAQDHELRYAHLLG